MSADVKSIIRIAIIAPALSMRLGLAAMLSEDAGMVVTASAANIDELESPPDSSDVLVLAGSALSIRAVGEYCSSLPENTIFPAVLILLDVPPDLSRLPDPLPEVIRGFLSVESSTEKLTQAVAALAAGIFVIEPAWASFLAKPAPSSLTLETAPSANLSPREIEVLHHLALGLANKQIGALLSLSENTIKYHISSIYSKLGASNRAEAVRLGARMGLISL